MMWNRFRKLGNEKNEVDEISSESVVDVTEDIIIEGFDEVESFDDTASDESIKSLETPLIPDSLPMSTEKNDTSLTLDGEANLDDSESLRDLDELGEVPKSADVHSPWKPPAALDDETRSVDVSFNPISEKIVIDLDSLHQNSEIDESTITSAENETQLEMQGATEHQDDLNEVLGRELPILNVPAWRDELDLVKKRIEPCDMTSHIVKVTRRRLLAKRIELILAEVQLKVYKRYLERASRRFSDRIDEDRVLREAMADMAQWRDAQAKSVAWVLAERVESEVQKAKAAEDEAKQYVMKNTEYQNPDAVNQYRSFIKRLVLIPIFNLYVISVVSLTFNRFEWILKHLPFFNLGLNNSIVMICGISSLFWLSNLWRYAKNVSRTQREVAAFNVEYEKQKNRITHAVREHTRLSQQQPMLEPILHVLSVGYRTQLQSSFDVKVNVTTKFDTETLPACVTLAKAVDTDQRRLTALRNKATRMLTRSGWRTDSLNNLAKSHAETNSTRNNVIGLGLLDVDFEISLSNSRRILLEAFDNLEMQNSVNTIRLRDVIVDLHNSVLAKWDSIDRPRVVSLRNDGFNKLSFKTSWLATEDTSEDWLEFLKEILYKTSPFGQLNIANKSSKLNHPDQIKSVAVVPHYFQEDFTEISKVEKSNVVDVMPIDVVVRVDVSGWGEPEDFAVFADRNSRNTEIRSVSNDDDTDSVREHTSV